MRIKEIASGLWVGAVAYVSLFIGAGLSIAGNVADTYRTRGPLTDVLDIVLAAAAPALVLLTVEMFVSPRWSQEKGFQALRWTGCSAIGVLAMFVSWVHLHELLVARGQMNAVAVFWPFAIDGMAIMSTGLILSTRQRAHKVERSLRFQYARPIGPMPLTLNEALTQHSVSELFAPLDSAPVSAPPAMSVKRERARGERSVSVSDAQRSALNALLEREAPALISERTGVSVSVVRKMRQALTAIESERGADVSAYKLNGALIALMREAVTR